MIDLRSLIRSIAIFVMFSVAAALHAQDGLSEALARISSSCNLSSGLFGSSVVTADFNHDSYPDGAVLLRGRNTSRIEVHFRFQKISHITFASNFPALAISALDVNHDGSPDLVIEDPFSHRRLFIWLNDGYGSFHEARVDDFPAGSDERLRVSGPPSHQPDSRALVTKSRVRIRRPSPVSARIADATNIGGFTSNLNLQLSAYNFSPKSLRGPPSFLFL